jgi:hypothetical protein
MRGGWRALVEHFIWPVERHVLGAELSLHLNQRRERIALELEAQTHAAADRIVVHGVDRQQGLCSVREGDEPALRNIAKDQCWVESNYSIFYYFSSSNNQILNNFNA